MPKSRNKRLSKTVRNARKDEVKRVHNDKVRKRDQKLREELKKLIEAKKNQTTPTQENDPESTAVEI